MTMSKGYNAFVGSDEYRNMLVVNGHLDTNYFGSSWLDIDIDI